MDSIIEQVLKAFTHLAREIQIYFLSGLIFIIEIFIIFDLDFKSILNMQITLWEYIVYSLLLYIIGQGVFSVYNIFSNEKIEKTNNIKTDDKIKYEINIFKHENKLYSEFIERYNILMMMRYNIAYTLFLSSIICIFNIIMNLINKDVCFNIIIMLIANIVIGLFMNKLANGTKTEFILRLKYLNEFVNNGK